MTPKAPLAITPKRLLVLPKKVALVPPKVPEESSVTGGAVMENRAPLIAPKKAQMGIPFAPKGSASLLPPARSVESRGSDRPMSAQGSFKHSNSGSNGGEPLAAQVSRRSSTKSMSTRISPVSGEVCEDAVKGNAVEADACTFSPPMDADADEQRRMGTRGTFKGNYGNGQHHRFPASVNDTAQMRDAVGKPDDTLDKWDTQKIMKVKSKGTSEEEGHNAIGDTPWLQIEKRINEIRAMGTNNIQRITGRNTKPSDQGAVSLYGNYNTHYEQASDWKQERCNPMSYTMIQNLQKKTKANTVSGDNWNMVNGFVKPRRKPFASMSELSRHFRTAQPHDKSELIKLLLACRELEKVIEEQHSVLDMLDHDLKEARAMMNIQEHLREISAKSLLGHAPQKEAFYPTSDIPLFVKGRVSLLPGSNDIQLSVVNNQ
ncbi:hypothetical protein BgAZ_200160 [Babesia gibsoni]|uniref:Uncharacterized protein n=1 Tax=Babesia gibsoni TaxID=33632 RepID=A0AAD8LSM0_BABGI|nr:hypothetical protein BgAZ_200160 [Babesia gibsoni]